MVVLIHLDYVLSADHLVAIISSHLGLTMKQFAVLVQAPSAMNDGYRLHRMHGILH